MTSTNHKNSSPGSKSLIIKHSFVRSNQDQSTFNQISNFRRSNGNQSSSPPFSRNNKNQHEKYGNSHRTRLLDGFVNEIMNEDIMGNTAVAKFQNSRRGQTSITHLMNFSLPPLPQDCRDTSITENQRKKCCKSRPYNPLCDKARYIHANYRFIVKPDRNYKSQIANVDLPIDWDDILQILVSSVSQDSSCPICLSRPVAPRMTKCGHILCLSCLIRYLNWDEKSELVPLKRSRRKECPICWDSIKISEVRPVRWYAGHENLDLRENDDVVLRLITRQPGKILALPKEESEIFGTMEDIPWYSPEVVSEYIRIMKGSQEYMIGQYNAEIEDLEKLGEEDEIVFEEKPEWTRKAISEINEAKKLMRSIRNPPHKLMKKDNCKGDSNHLPGNDKDDCEDSCSIQGLKTCQKDNGIQDSGSKFRSRQKNNFKDQNCVGDETYHLGNPFFFYQALPHYYLAPLDIRILKSAYGNFDLFPPMLLPCIEHVSNGQVMSTELRKRMKYLSHLPQGCEIKFLECNWSGIIAPEILSQFSNEIEMRRKRNNEKQIREERERQQVLNAEEDAQWIISGIRYREERESFSNEIFKNPIISPNASSIGTVHQASSVTPETVESVGPKTVWGTLSVGSSSAEVLTQPERLHDNDGWLQTWEAELQVENTLITQAKNLSLNVRGSLIEPASGKGVSKKKKTKKITLMSTTARRAA